VSPAGGRYRSIAAAAARDSRIYTLLPTLLSTVAERERILDCAGGFYLPCFDAVGWASGRASGL